MRRIQVFSNRGHYNWANPHEESISTHIAIYSSDKKLQSINITTKEVIDDNGPCELASLIKEYASSLIFSTNKEKLREMVNFLESNGEELERGNKEYQLQKLIMQKTKLEKQIAQLEDEL